MMKLKSNQTRTYDGDGYKKRAACLCFRSESEEEVRRGARRDGVAGRLGPRRGGAAAGGGCFGARIGPRGPKEVPMNFLRTEERMGKGWWCEGKVGPSCAGGREMPLCSRGAWGRAPVTRESGRGDRQWAGRGPRLDPGRAARHLSARHMCAEAAVHEAQAGLCGRRPLLAGLGLLGTVC